jgi:DNA polymerase-3 subunit epsilon
LDPANVRPFYMFLDTETTDLPHCSDREEGVTIWPRLVQIAWLQVDGQRREMSAASHIIKPIGFTIPVEATKIHHITTEQALEEGEEIPDVLIDFERLVRASDSIVAHNLAFDEGVVMGEFNRAGLATVLPSREKICTMEQSTEFCALEGLYGPKWPKLSELNARLFGARLEESHDASVDVRTAAKCFWELKNRGVWGHGVRHGSRPTIQLAVTHEGQRRKTLGD